MTVNFVTPIFKKLDAFIPALSLLLKLLFLLGYCYWFSITPSRNNNEITNPCVFLFIILYIYSKHMYFCVKYFLYLCWRQFSKSWTPSFLPYPCSLIESCFVCLLILHKQTKQDSRNLPTPVCFFLLYYI